MVCEITKDCHDMMGELTVSRYVAKSITTDAGRFGHVGLCQLRTCTQLTKAYMAETSCIVVIDFAMYLLTVSSPDIDNIAMSLYDII